MKGTIYLVHFAQRYRHARHYLGWAKSLPKRIKHHRSGTGARLLQVVNDQGIPWDVVRTWEGDRHRERQLKNQGGASRLCPVCRKQKEVNSVTRNG